MRRPSSTLTKLRGPEHELEGLGFRVKSGTPNIEAQIVGFPHNKDPNKVPLFS